ncbi:MAG: 2-C-methyl-D-erythritol 4-phosphate cytidylyltransferase [Balneolaceae bacterium]|nr:2-C-methyl-D-erythritol 4-phosphate cytidylyltransferase [Balneolaceae bacterium]MBO6545963.1 2-C-methyl-D-erythritol 4-phosphate cytidylyltransferase [Balneolaceae bacterium]MBO6647359.1 2-C-methyl-D-erythritol 4-phosphate cytidylyltransferase [Balneolaceae bacterium]
MSKLAVIIPAAGSGSRMGARVPKPFLKLRGVSILEHTIRAFARVDEVDQIIVSTSSEWIIEVKTILENFKGEVKSLDVVVGGKERQDSIYNAFSKISVEIDLIAVHDAVRPFICKELIKECCETASAVGGAIVAVPAKDTIKKVNIDLVINSTPDRSDLWQAQTPQIFQKNLLIEAYDSAIQEKFMGTDDASLVERIGGVVKIIEGDRRNLKITYPIDLKVAELILDERGEE